MIPPPNPASGPAASVAALERLRQFAISSNVTSGGGLRKAFGGGSVFSIPETKRQRPSFGGAATYPFDLTLTDAGATYTGKFRPGTVNGLIPSNYLSLTGIAKTGTVYIGIVCTFSNAAVQTAVFAAGGTAPPAYLVTKNVPPTDLSILTHVVVDGAVYRVLGTNSITVAPIKAFETDKSGTLVPGERPVDYWYSYSVTS
jgi:hypothetical protein